MMPWRLCIKCAMAGLLAFLLFTVYLQHEHNITLVTKLNFAKDALKVADEQMRKNQEAQQQAAELDKKYTEQLADAQTQIDKLRNDVISGNKRLRIKAQCVSDNTTSGRMGANTAVELSRETGSTVLDIRSGIVSDRTKIEYFQDYISKIQQLTHN